MHRALLFGYLELLIGLLRADEDRARAEQARMSSLVQKALVFYGQREESPSQLYHLAEVRSILHRSILY
jgi:hypothetical protein